MPESTGNPFARIVEYYDGLIQEYGHHPRACDYGRIESQEAKFHVLSEVQPLSNSTLLDVGCGFADFATYLQARFPSLQYSGVDLCPAMVAEARRSHPNLDLRNANIFDMPLDRTYDVVTANGIFYLLGDQAWPMMQKMVERMYALADSALAFNSLSSWALDQERGELYADPLQTMDFCRRLTPRVVLRHDYHARDFTVYMYKREKK